MKWLGFIALLASPALAEIIYYGDKPRTVELRSTDSSILLFPNPPISSSCHPAGLSFEPMANQNLSALELNTVRSQNPEEGLPEQDNELLKRMLRVTPVEKTGQVQCAFTLTNAEEVSVRFDLQADLAKPLIEFRTISAKFPEKESEPQLTQLLALMEGKPVGLEDVTKDYQKCTSREHGPSSCRNLTFETDLAIYEISFIASNTRSSAWILETTLKVNTPFQKAADLKVTDGKVTFSLTTPQKDRYLAGEKIKHRLIAIPTLTPNELKEVLP